MKLHSAMNGNRLAILIIIVTVSNGLGCNRYWVNPDGLDSYDKDSYECKMETSFVRHSGSSSATADSEDYRSSASYNTSLDYDPDLYESCMNARGYRLVSERERRASREEGSSAGRGERSRGKSTGIGWQPGDEIETREDAQKAQEYLNSLDRKRQKRATVPRQFEQFCDVFGIDGSTSAQQTISTIRHTPGVHGLSVSDIGEGELDDVAHTWRTFGFHVYFASNGDEKPKLTVGYRQSDFEGKSGLTTTINYSTPVGQLHDPRSHWIGKDAEAVGRELGVGNGQGRYRHIGQCGNGTELSFVNFYSNNNEPIDQGGTVNRVEIIWRSIEEPFPKNRFDVFPAIEVEIPGGYEWGSSPLQDGELIYQEGTLSTYQVGKGADRLWLWYYDDRLESLAYWDPRAYDTIFQLFTEAYGPVHVGHYESKSWELRDYIIEAYADDGEFDPEDPERPPGVQVVITNRAELRLAFPD